METLSADDLHHRLRLIRCNLPAPAVQQLLQQFSSAQAIFAASGEQLEACGLNESQISRLQQPHSEGIQRDLSWLENENHGILFYDSEAYPAPLKGIEHAPYGLFYIGDIDYLRQPQLAMVGSRTATAAGRQTARDFAHHLSSAGISITSGLAHGIDAASHEGALKGMAGTVAVVANGLHTIYPKSNTGLAQAISQNGCIISESPVGTDPHKGLFPRRNRIISGLAMGTLVVEAAVNSGSLITSRHAMEQGREVFAIPGSIHNPLSKGCHQLIKQGAKLVESASDILEELFPLVNSASIRHTSATESTASSANDTPAVQQNSHETLDPGYHILLKHMEFEPVGIDELVQRSQLEAAEIASMLLILELQGLVTSHKGLYSRMAEPPANQG